jgi:hypothetical protein
MFPFDRPAADQVLDWSASRSRPCGLVFGWKHQPGQRCLHIPLWTNNLA